MTAQVLENLLHQAECLPISERLLLVEHLIKGIRQKEQPTKNTFESACGILQAPHSVSLEQMEEAIRQRGGYL